MSTSQSTIDHLLDQLSGLANVRVRKMFGEYALYCDEEGEAYPGAKPSMLISAEELDDGERLCELIRLTADALPAPRPKSPKAARSKRSK